MLALAFALLWLAPVAQAVPPGNDDFANAESLGIGLPVDITRTNVEATREMDEPWHGATGSLESVWFEWEAEVTGFVTVGACDGDFKAFLAVYTGTTLSSLVKAVDGNGNEGPNCPFAQREYTFKAIGGTEYKIAVTGDAFHSPGGPKPITAGEFDLRIEATPPPANDDFQNAAVVSGEISEEPDGTRLYMASAPGYNWLATKEAGEPVHGPDQGGASIWYSWTAPESGFVRMNVCCGPGKSIAAYTGASVDSLTQREPTSSWPFPYEGFLAERGTTYRIAIDGKFDSGSGSVEMGSFRLLVLMDLPPLSPPAQVVPGPAIINPDVTPPKTTVSKRVLKRTPPVVVLNFTSSEPGSTFRCKLDKRAFTACRSPRRLKNLSPGRHTFKVVATDAAGNADRTPAKVSFRIPEPQQ